MSVRRDKLAGPQQGQLDSTFSSSYEAGADADEDTRKRPSIPVEVKGDQYLLKAEDAELLQDILRQNLLHLEGSGISGRHLHRFRDLEFTRQLSTFDRQNPSLSSSQFRGFFTLFWLGVALLLVKVAANNWRDHGTIWAQNEIVRLMFHKDVLVLGLTDFVLCWCTTFCLGLQRVLLKGYLRWNGLGWIIQHIWQTAYLAGFIWWTYHRDWAWTHTVFTVLHCLAMLMKQHSYASYNGYLSELYHKRELLITRLGRLEKQSKKPAVPGAQTSAVSKGLGSEIASLKRQNSRQRSIDLKNIQSDSSHDTDHLLLLSETIENGTPLAPRQMMSLKSLLEKEIELLTQALKGQSKSSNPYPGNLTIGNFCDFITLPTLVYELEYPRTERIDWAYVVEKTAATFGTIVVMIVISQHWIYPVVMSVLRMEQEGMTVEQRLQEFPWVLSDLLFPFMMEYLLAFYVIWECVLNALAEITQFADRGFYADWWNSVSWDQFARDWNRPVHNFLLRHVYHSSISTFDLSRVSASLVTFFLSACVHELIMLCIFRRLRGYLLILQMSQLPLVSLSRTRFMRDRQLVGNVVFWLGIFMGPSFLCTCCTIGVKHEGEAKGQIKQVGDVEVYFSYPSNRQTKRAILLLTDVIGHRFINAQLIADQFAANGYFVVMPDLFHGDPIDPVPENRPPGFDLMKWLNGPPGHLTERVDPVVKAVLKEMKSNLGCERIGGVGYCFGAKYAVRFLQPGNIDVSYVAHPSFVEADELAAIKGPLSIAAAETDSIFPTPKRHESEEILLKTGQPYQINLFSGVEHGFAVRADITKPIIRFAKESAFTQAVVWFNQHL
ncbi:Sterol O-acyltransferase ACAT/DAG/ARE [Penicillium waksmanii]|uniref:Sterol O-acyltransferase ACAT/DAG/ARE n=1 Tax=Penicillium waksmanii TaxID=69791 RepID=UPI002547C45B|nr:Sterol O-acyltransferase ACAT/DAG/ARE [Penicillium waksmanii]KAJ5988296.1 Sterol O-acyltransferase ACAT/DAG/ARE [Penicillium waksmanii]